MGFQQKKLADLSEWLGRFRAIYKWKEEEKSQIFCLCSIFLGILLWLSSLRFIFSIGVFGLMFKHSPFRRDDQRNSKGMIDRYFEAITPDIPQIDDEDGDGEEDEDDDDSSDNQEEESDTKSSDGSDNNNNNIGRIKQRVKKKLRKRKGSTGNTCNVGGGAGGGRKSSTSDSDTQNQSIVS